MIHLFRHSTGKLNGKYDIALVEKGNLIWATPQGYNKKSEAIKKIYTSTVKQVTMEVDKRENLKAVYCYFQDDTKTESVVCYLMDKKVTSTLHKPTKPYIPFKSKNK